MLKESLERPKFLNIHYYLYTIPFYLLFFDPLFKIQLIKEKSSSLATLFTVAITTHQLVFASPSEAI